VFYWVPGHAGLPGMKAANAATKEAAVIDGTPSCD